MWKFLKRKKRGYKNKQRQLNCSNWLPEILGWEYVPDGGLRGSGASTGH